MKERTASQKRKKEVSCWRHGVAPAYGSKDDLKCLTCAREKSEARKTGTEWPPRRENDR